jgi:hypothetical protein
LTLNFLRRQDLKSWLPRATGHNRLRAYNRARRTLKKFSDFAGSRADRLFKCDANRYKKRGCSIEERNRFLREL